MNWKAGDIAICIDNSGTSSLTVPPPLRLNVEYVVHSVKECKCGILLDVGLYAPEVVICSCGKNLTDKIWWCYSRRFKKKEYAQEILKQIFQTEEA